MIDCHHFVAILNMRKHSIATCAGPNAAHFCEHIYGIDFHIIFLFFLPFSHTTIDRIGCMSNAPAAYTNCTFESCKGDDPGVYTRSDGVGSYVL